MLDRPLPPIVEHRPITGAGHDTLNGAYNRQGLALQLAIAWGRGHWDAIAPLCPRLGCSQPDVWHWQEAARAWGKGLSHRKGSDI